MAIVVFYSVPKLRFVETRTVGFFIILLSLIRIIAPDYPATIQASALFFSFSMIWALKTIVKIINQEPTPKEDLEGDEGVGTFSRPMDTVVGATIYYRKHAWELNSASLDKAKTLQSGDSVNVKIENQKATLI